MLEIFIDKKENQEKVALIENGNLVEYYEEDEETDRKEGNIYVGTVKDIIPGMQSAFIDIGTEKNGFIHLKDILPKVDEKNEKLELNLDIKKVIKPNQKLLVQIKKDSNDKKGARTSTHIKLTGKYLVLMPNTNIVTISQKIVDEKEKQRLLDIIKAELPENTGAILRTAAEHKSKEEIKKDFEQLMKKWEKIKTKFNNGKNSPEVLFRSPSIIEKIILDLPEDRIEKIEVNDQDEYNEIKEMLVDMDENIKIELKDGLLEKYELRKQIEKSKQRKIWLNCGGFITIDPTEALIAIDVNSGKFTGKSTLEETIYKVNYEATIEIAKQLRLRDIGGIIIIDYIDMLKPENKEKIENLLKECLKQDRAKTQVEGFTNLNLMELTRKHICSHNS